MNRIQRPKVAKNIIETIGNTPLVELGSMAKGLPGRVLVKLEFFNPMSSVKDRIGASMIESAEKDGRLKPGMTIVEPTSGNTGIGLALVKGIAERMGAAVTGANAEGGGLRVGLSFEAVERTA